MSPATAGEESSLSVRRGLGLLSGARRLRRERSRVPHGCRWRTWRGRRHLHRRRVYGSGAFLLLGPHDRGLAARLGLLPGDGPMRAAQRDACHLFVRPPLQWRRLRTQHQRQLRVRLPARRRAVRLHHRQHGLLGRRRAGPSRDGDLQRRELRPGGRRLFLWPMPRHGSAKPRRWPDVRGHQLRLAVVRPGLLLVHRRHIGHLRQ